jgi:beta-glucosidase
MDVADLTEEETLALFSGLDAWHFEGVPRLGIPPLQVTDCGHGVSLVAPPYGSATCFPTAIGMAATWDRDLLYETGRALGREARAKGCGMLLGPMVNLHRVPCGGRNYETFSEDPVLTGKLAAALVNGLQTEGTGSCVKVFLCNNQQQNQKDTSSVVDERTLQEIYLKVFRIILRESDPWAIMTSYNPVNGEYPGDSRHWLKHVLRGELGFSGVIISDWNALQGTGSLTSTLDIEMPGPGKVLTPKALRQALKDGRISLQELQNRAGRILEMHKKARPAREGNSLYSPPELDSSRHRQLAREVATASVVLLKNRRSLLPLKLDSIRRIAVIGPNAANARLGGGGSASVLPFYCVSPLEGIRNAVPQDVEINYAEGCSMDGGALAIPPCAFSNGWQPEEGLHAEYFLPEAFDRGGRAALERVDEAIDFSWGWAAPATGLPRESYAMRWTGFLHSPVSGPVTLTLKTSQSVARVWLDEHLILNCWSAHDPGNFEDRFTNRQASVEVRMSRDRPLSIRVEFRKTGWKAALRLGWHHPGMEDPVDEAVRLAADSDVAVVFAGLSNLYEGGAHDREDFSMPGRQDDLIRAVAAANPDTIVVLKNGTPVCMETWRESVPAIIEAFYPGQEGGNAIADIIFGRVNPSGKLPDTLPKSWQDVSSMRNYPGRQGRVEYGEKMMVGYRHFDKAGIEPAFPFGYGLSYSIFEYGRPDLSADRIRPGKPVEVSVEIRNTGRIPGRETVQLYKEPVQSSEEWPVSELLDFLKLDLKPGESRRARFVVRYEDFLSYNTETYAWEPICRHFRLCCGPHSRSGQKVAIQISPS